MIPSLVFLIIFEALGDDAICFLIVFLVACLCYAKLFGAVTGFIEIDCTKYPKAFFYIERKRKIQIRN
jgi:hypothetical protein